MNVGLVRLAGGEWNGNLDAFNDYLSWPSEAEYELELVDSANCRASLGHGAMASWLEAHIETCHPSNVESFRARLAEAQRGSGETLFDMIQSIVADNPHVRLVLS